MSRPDDLRLIEDYLPIEAISAEASREKSVRKGHISTLHLWWARRPLVACRAAVYGALVPADGWVKDLDVKTPPADPAKAEAFRNRAKRGLKRMAAKDFVTKLCRYPKNNPTKLQEIKVKRETEAAIVEAQRHILEAHAQRLTAELAEARTAGKQPAWVDEFKFIGDKVTYEDILACRAPRPRVLDLFAGGGAIPLEALRLDCEAYALELNPVAHIIELCTLVYPQTFGKPDKATRGMTGAKNHKSESTWGGLASEVRHWGNWVIDRVRKEIGHLYPPIPDPDLWATPPTIAFDHATGKWQVAKEGKLKRGARIDSSANASSHPAEMFEGEEDDLDQSSEVGAFDRIPEGHLIPISYMWTRTVPCPNPACQAVVPMARQTWLARKKGRNIAASMKPHANSRRVVFDVVTAANENDLGFDPGDLNSRGSTVCPFCAAAVANTYAQKEGIQRRLGTQLVAVGAVGRASRRRYFSPAAIAGASVEADTEQVLESLARNGLTVPDEEIPSDRRESFWCRSYGLTHFSDVFTRRQLAALLTFCRVVCEAAREATASGLEQKHAQCLATYLGILVDRIANQNNGLCIYNAPRETVEGLLASKKCP
jgi:putative DNA methylase